MTWDEIEGNWLHFKGKLRHNWAKLTDEDVTRINGRRDELAAGCRNATALPDRRPSARSAPGSAASVTRRRSNA